METESNPVIDKFNALDRLDGDEVLYTEILQIFLTEVPRQLELLKRSLGKSDPAQVEKVAHALKSAAGTVGAEQMRSIVSELESAGRSHNLEKAKVLMPRLENAFNAVLKASDSAVGTQ